MVMLLVLVAEVMDAVIDELDLGEQEEETHSGS